MTGRENLRLLARIDGIGAARVDDVLERVGLAGRADDLVRRLLARHAPAPRHWPPPC